MHPTADARTAFNSEQYENPYPPGIERHYWHQARNRILARKLRPVLRPGARALDIGCGPGLVVSFLRGMQVDCLGVDLGTPTPATPDVAPFLKLGTSAFELPLRERESFTLLLLMDVLEHLREPAAFLGECEAHFPNVKHVFVTLPARMEIWSTYDEYYGHLRRYTLESIAEVASQTSLRLVASGYYFHLLYAAARVISKKRSVRVVAPKIALPHRVLGKLLALEEAVAPASMPGSSLYALYER